MMPDQHLLDGRHHDCSLPSLLGESAVRHVAFRLPILRYENLGEGVRRNRMIAKNPIACFTTPGGYGHFASHLQRRHITLLPSLTFPCPQGEVAAPAVTPTARRMLHHAHRRQGRQIPRRQFQRVILARAATRNSLTNIATTTIPLGRADLARTGLLLSESDAVPALKTDGCDGKGERRSGFRHAGSDPAG